MEYVNHDDRTVTVKVDRDEIIDLLQVLNSVAQEYDGLDVEILNLNAIRKLDFGKVVGNKFSQQF